MALVAGSATPEVRRVSFFRQRGDAALDRSSCGARRRALTRSFTGLFARGARRVALHVDADSPEALRLYHRAGMHIVFQIDHYEKTLR
jgi:hypothetical protein